MTMARAGELKRQASGWLQCTPSTPELPRLRTSHFSSTFACGPSRNTSFGVARCSQWRNIGAERLPIWSPAPSSRSRADPSA